MNVLLVGNGGREAALAWRIARSPSLGQLVVTGDNPGWPEEALVRPAKGNAAIVALARGIEADLVVVGPEQPLADGLADALEAAGIACFGPSASAARLETSKTFAKEVMARAGVPTAGYVVVDSEDPDSVERGFARCARGRVVVKADGLAAGKGVAVCVGPDEADAALQDALDGRYGDASKRVVLEDLLVGPEVSVFALCDGERVVPLLTACDHKRLGDGDTGPNTGGMGAYAPAAWLDHATEDSLYALVHTPVVRAMAELGAPFRGVLYAGLMMTPDGPRVLEFNVRFGDPECQVLMALWEDDVLPWLATAAAGRLPAGRPAFADGSAVVVVLASPGYPERSTPGIPIPEPDPESEAVVFFAGAKRDGGRLVTAGGRVLGVTAMAATLAQARQIAYASVDAVRFEGAQLRTDIAAPGPR